MKRFAAVVVASCLQPAVGSCVDATSGCDADEGASLLSVKRHRQSDIEGSNGSVMCPGSEVSCSASDCCPGIAATSGKTFPCPRAARNLKCEAGGEALVEALLSAMTKEEKYRFVRGVGWTEGTWENIRGYYIGDAGLQQRFGLPALNMQDNGQGFRTTDRVIIDQVTSWPETLAITSSWSEEDTERFAIALGKEFRRKGANVILGPGVNVARVARGGRNGEYISGEDAYLGSRLVKPYVKGIQSQKVLAVVKHLGNNNQENDRDHVNSIVDKRTMWEVYYPPFEAAVQAGVAVAMCSYNLVNGVHACGNPDILINDFKGRMGFKGWVQSDWWANHDFVARQGVDQEMPGTSSGNTKRFYTDENLATLNDSELDKMVRPQLSMMHKHGLLEPEKSECQPPHCDSHMFEINATDAEHQALSRELATKAVLLLKNEGVLPFTSDVKKIAVLGSACRPGQNVDKQLYQWDLGDYYNIGGSGRVIAWDPVSIFDALTAKCAQRGCEIVSELSDNVDAAVQLAEGADVAVMCGGTSSTEGHDRSSLSVDQESFMVKVAAAVSTTLVTLTMTPAAVVMPWAQNADAVVNLFLAGKYTGNAFADVLFGDVNPSAKSPVTFPLSEKDTVLPCAQIECPYTEGLFTAWHGLQDKPVLFPFGHGLSYSRFRYSSLSVFTEIEKMAGACSDAAVCVTARVTNTGKVPGVEVAQLYLGFPLGTNEPGMLLRGFVRSAELAPGASADITFPLVGRDMQFFDVKSDGWATPHGQFAVYVGSSSRDIRLDSSFTM